MKSIFNNRFRSIYIISATGLLLGLILSSNAWSTSRTYPLVPILDGFFLPGWFQTALLLLVSYCLVIGVFSSSELIRKISTTTSVLGLLALVLLDITRLQPWILHYVAVLLLFSLLIPSKYRDHGLILDAARIIVGGIYFWSGIQKINPRFFSEIFPWFTENLWRPFGEPGAMVAVAFGLLVPFIEAGFALGFFSKKFRNISLLGATGMILIVILSIGPSGREWNSSVWPWNFGIYFSALLLFGSTSFNLKEFLLRQKHNVLAWAAFSIFWIMPLGNLVGLTDHYLSWSLYSGKVPEAALLGDQSFLEKLSPAAANGELRLIRWTIEDLNLVPYPERRVFEAVFENICRQYPNEPITMKIESFLGVNNSFNDQRSYMCNQ